MERFKTVLFSLVVLLIATGCQSQSNKTMTDTHNIGDVAPTASSKTLVLGAGCFWCVEAVYELIEGVQSVESGYAGGKIENPTYQQVSSGSTQHAEVVKIVYDSTKVTFSELIDTFWEMHDPTTLNRQGNDVGPQYRSILFYNNDAELEAINASMEKAQKDFHNSIVTQVVPEQHFYIAEKYHQDYFRHNPTQSYVVHVVAPKVKKYVSHTNLPLKISK